MIETGTSHWQSPNTGATNESGFSALPAGGRNPTPVFSFIGSRCLWWSSTETDMESAFNRYLLYDSAILGGGVYGSFKVGGWSIRCIKD